MPCPVCPAFKHIKLVASQKKHVSINVKKKGEILLFVVLYALLVYIAVLLL